MAGYLEQHPEALEHIMPEEEWEEFEPATHLTPAFSKAMLEEVKQGIAGETPVKRIRSWWWAAAAVVAGLLALALWPSGREKSGPPKTMAAVARKVTASPEKIIENKEQEKIRIPMEDGSVVELGPNSRLKWKPGHRNVYLEGMARFTVTASAAHPFVVYTKQVTTTVLGTVFEINARASTHIRLVSGKVMIRPAADTLQEHIVYLEPGQAADFREISASFEVYRSKPAGLKATPPPAMGSVEQTTGAFVYTKVPLPQLLEGLEKQYGIRISYSPARLKKFYFSGQLLKTETPANILNMIGLLNKLSVTQDSTGFHISK